MRPRLNRAAELAARAGQKKREEQEKRAADVRKEMLGGGWCGAARPAWVENDEALSKKIEAGLTGKKEDDALSPLRASNSPSSKAEKAATAWLKKARNGDVPLDVAEVEAVVAVLKRCRGVIPDDAKEAAPMTLAEARRCLKKAVAQLVAGDASVEVEVERWDAWSSAGTRSTWPSRPRGERPGTPRTPTRMRRRSRRSARRCPPT